jgi:hypothetical protein
MSLYLLTFHRRKLAEPILADLDPDEALVRLLEAEDALRGSDFGVVLLVADDEEALRRTHSQYFETFDELLAEPA